MARGTSAALSTTIASEEDVENDFDPAEATESMTDKMSPSEVVDALADAPASARTEPASVPPPLPLSVQNPPPAFQQTVRFDPSMTAAAALVAEAAKAGNATQVLPSMPAQRTVKLSAEDLRQSGFVPPPPPGSPTLSMAPVPPVSVPAPRPVARSPRRMSVRAQVAVSCIVILGLGLASYLVVALLFSANRTWLSPMVIAKEDPRAVAATASANLESARLSDLRLRARELQLRYDDTKRVVAIEESFQRAYMSTLHADIAASRAEMRRLEALAAAEDASQDEAAGRDGTAAKVSLLARRDAVRARLSLLAEAVDGASRATSVRSAQPNQRELLGLRREYDRSTSLVAEATESMKSLEKSIGEANGAARSQEDLVADIERSPFRLAAKGDAMLAFVPYSNEAAVVPGVTVLGCRATFAVCKPVGTVAEVLPGEFQGTHPMRGGQLRGHLVRLDLADAKWGREALLFAGTAPLHF